MPCGFPPTYPAGGTVVLGVQGGPQQCPGKVCGGWQGQEPSRGCVCLSPPHQARLAALTLLSLCVFVSRCRDTGRGGAQGQRCWARAGQGTVEVLTVRGAKCPAQGINALLPPSPAPSFQQPPPPHKMLRRVLCFQNFEHVPSRTQAAQEPGYEVPEGVGVYKGPGPVSTVPAGRWVHRETVRASGLACHSVGCPMRS